MFLVLAQVEIFNCQSRQPVSMAQQRSARPPKTPHIASGVAKNPAWSTKHSASVSVTGLGVTIGLPYRTTIDTTSGDFQANPTYIARLVGSRVDDTTNPTTLKDALINIPSDSVSPTSFDLEIFPVTATLNKPARFIGSARIPTWDVVWLGVEG
jgi:hypothetical protein